MGAVPRADRGGRRPARPNIQGALGGPMRDQGGPCRNCSPIHSTKASVLAGVKRTDGRTR
jgi:hypothetical protein